MPENKREESWLHDIEGLVCLYKGRQPPMREQESPIDFDTDLFHATGIRPKRNKQKTRWQKFIGWFK